MLGATTLLEKLPLKNIWNYNIDESLSRNKLILKSTNVYTIPNASKNINNSTTN